MKKKISHYSILIRISVSKATVIFKTDDKMRCNDRYSTITTTSSILIK